ncbi:MAG: nicotinate (nicotinamide) nucleotide adenylyltransferase [Candidatus Gastranaerophilales bacterium]|nr:nicotinate (nicotinamide) nucleotide adenylyltransferase [Candidatus Gastranaerophilales bacterium]
MRLCVYQGTFNPIHNAHLEVAQFVYENFNFDKLLFIPAFIPPHKHNYKFDGELAQHRYNMLNLALEDYPAFDLSDIEYRRNEPSYTYYTIQEIYYSMPIKEKISFIIGTDAFRNIDSWHQAYELKNMVDFILFVRDDNFDETEFLELKENGFNYQLAKMPYHNISSSEVRKRVKEGRKIHKLVPHEVANYIKEYGLYKD